MNLRKIFRKASRRTTKQVIKSILVRQNYKSTIRKKSAKATMVAFALALCAKAHAQPPANADPVLAPYFKSLQAPDGTGCCSDADCRILLDDHYRQDSKGQWWALIDKRSFGADAPNKWLAVPSDLISPKPPYNPTEGAVACWASWRVIENGFYCFEPPQLGD